MRILLVEDDKNLGKATTEGLKDLYAVDWVLSSEDAEEALGTTSYAMIVLDINLPGASGLDLLAGLRRGKKAIPVLLLTARDAVRHRVEGLNAGADDYLIKPFDLDELLARCAALIRRGSGQAAPVINHGNISYEAAQRYVEKDGKPVTLSSRELAVFDCLIRNAGRPVSKEKIMENVYDWSSEEIESNTIEVHIAALRKKLGRDLIKTIRGVGYIIAS
ncbi:MAG: response regulator [Alphaproteobacteria bacterium]|nr:response regulator [Alphaproteobacteria bacterium]MCD8519757.1 response regulator [Alphaproteobacteria bacterium]MCD8525770.1 response regulator [Alphaproteobacteria bacterium]